MMYWFDSSSRISANGCIELIAALDEQRAAAAQVDEPLDAGLELRFLDAAAERHHEQRGVVGAHRLLRRRGSSRGWCDRRRR